MSQTNKYLIRISMIRGPMSVGGRYEIHASDYNEALALITNKIQPDEKLIGISIDLLAEGDNEPDQESISNE